MISEYKPILLDFPDHEPNSHEIKSYLSRGGYQNLGSARAKYTPTQLVEEVKKSGLRGRGGAGFPTGMKWSFLAKNTGKAPWLVINADEGEPGTFKDRYLMERNPHQLIEGIILSCYALNIEKCVIYIRGEFNLCVTRVEKAIEEAYGAGYLGKKVPGLEIACDIIVHVGAGAYICGEETALLESIEGKKGQPRIKPPFPAVKGLFDGPTIINNVESIAAICYITKNGGDGFAQYGTEKSRGTKLVSISGPVKKPGVYEVELGVSVMDMIHSTAGGMLNGVALKALIVGGSSVPILTAEEALSLNYDYESCQAKGTFLGSGGMIVIGEGTCMVKALQVLLQFYHHESCGQCTPCREGTGWLEKIVERIEAGHGKKEDLDVLFSVADNMMGKTICALADAAAMPTISYLKKFRSEFEEHVRLGRCPSHNEFVDLKLL